VHNHRLYPALYDLYLNKSIIAEEKLFNEVRAMVEANGNTRTICDIIASRLGHSFTRQQFDNFKRYKLGGGTAIDGLKTLLNKFVSLSGSRCLIIEDQDDMACGFVIQSGIQRAMFQRWGDCLILDWTHNTNNMGYHLGQWSLTVYDLMCVLMFSCCSGSLMATSPTGKGVSVLDFLCVTQTKDMMRAVLHFFIQHNPNAVAKVRSFIIDKDYREWQVLEEVFPNSPVVLCQFHVIKWLRQVVAMEKYRLEKSTGKLVLKSLQGMVYASNIAEYEHQQRVVDSLLQSPQHDELKTYLESRWYAIRSMWSNCERGQIFTATNTTSNRIESNWKQLKDLLSKKTRIDKCVEAVLKLSTMALRREAKAFTNFAGKQFMHSSAHHFVKPLLSELSNYSGKIVTKEWDGYMHTQSAFNNQRLNANVIVVRTTYPRVAQYLVNSQMWSCTCNGYRTSNLPCKHLFFVAKDVLGCTTYPLQGIPDEGRCQHVGGTRGLHSRT
jgi:Transposase